MGAIWHYSVLALDLIDITNMQWAAARQERSRRIRHCTWIRFVLFILEYLLVFNHFLAFDLSQEIQSC